MIDRARDTHVALTVVITRIQKKKTKKKEEKKKTNSIPSSAKSHFKTTRLYPFN